LKVLNDGELIIDLSQSALPYARPPAPDIT